MLSRVAEALYWIGRFVERAENTARVLDVNYLALMEAPLVPGARGIVGEQWAPLLAVFGEGAFRERFDRADAQSVPAWLALHRDNPGSIRSSLASARENARGLRDRISLEMWEAINTAWRELCAEAPDHLEEDALHDYCAKARDASHRFFGIADATLPRDLGWYFIRAGQYLERADNTIRTLTVRYRQFQGPTPVGEGITTHRAVALLKSLSAYEAFRKRHGSIAPERIAAFLLLDPYFPRSVRFSTRVLAEILEELRARNPDTSDEAHRRAGWLAARLAYLVDVDAVLHREEPGLEELLVALASISDAIADVYFPVDRTAAQRQRQG